MRRRRRITEGEKRISWNDGLHIVDHGHDRLVQRPHLALAKAADRLISADLLYAFTNKDAWRYSPGT